MASVVTAAVKLAPKASKPLGTVTKPRREAKSIKKQVQHQLKGVSKAKLDSNPITPFQAQVYALTQEIPVGSVTTYGALAQLLSSSPRAVGQALKRNPFAPIVPCHRVIAQNGLGGFFGHVEGEQMDKKAMLLKQEGVPMIDEKNEKSAPLGFTSVIIDGSCILDASSFEAKMKEASKAFSFPTKIVSEVPTTPAP